MKRYCQTLELYDDKELIEAYVAEHAHVWEEVKAGIREVGITDMQIYIDGNLFVAFADFILHPGYFHGGHFFF